MSSLPYQEITLAKGRRPLIPVNPTLAEAHSLLSGPRMRAFTQALTASIDAINKLEPPLSLSLDESSKAHVINRNWYYETSVNLDSDPGVVRGASQNPDYFVIVESMIVRHKHF